MTKRLSFSSRTIDESQLAKVHGTVNLLGRHLHAEERDATASAYRLAWYRRLETKVCHRDDIEQFRRFVDEMCERATQRDHCTQALFPSSATNEGFGGELVLDIMRARRLCESFCASIKDGNDQLI